MANYTATRSMNLEACIKGTHEFAYDNESGGPFSYSASDPDGGESLSWTSGTGKLWHLEDDGTTGYMIIELLTGTAPVDNDTITGGTSSATCDVDGSVSATGPMADGEDLTIDNSVTVRCTQSPSILMGNVTKNGSGEYFVDGENISAGNCINHVGEYQQAINANGSGEFKVRGDWYSLGTTDGTDSQTLSLSSYWGGLLEDAVPAIWIETGRRIDYDNNSGVDPLVDDWVFKATDNTVFGRIVEVNTSGNYLVVKYLTESLVNDDDIVVKKIVDNKGPDLQITWSAKVNNASGDIKEDGIYQSFGNARTYGVDRLSLFGTGVGGFVFDQEFQSNTITLGSSSGGFVPPSGCDIRIPNVHFSTSNLTNYASGDTYHGGAYVYNWYELLTTNSGSVDIKVCNVGSASFSGTGASGFSAEHVGACNPIGSDDTAYPVSFIDCVVTSDPVLTSGISIMSFNTSEQVSTVNIEDCLVVKSADTRSKIGVGNAKNGSAIKNCIVTYGGAAPYGVSSCYYVTESENVTIDNCIGIGPNGVSHRLVYVQGSKDITVSNFIGSTTQDYNVNSTDSMFFDFVSGTNDCKVVWLEVLGTGVPSTNLIRFYQAYDIKIRCIGRITDKLDFQDHTNRVAVVTRYADRIHLARIWTTNGDIWTGSARYDIFAGPLVNNDIEIVNCSSDYASGCRPIGLDKLYYKGYQAASGNPGGYDSIEDSLAGCFGNQFHSIFKSDTSGYISCSMVPSSADINFVTVLSGDPQFNNNGSLNMANSDSLEIEQGWIALGNVAFTGKFTATVGSAAWYADEWTNITVEFQYDVGGGYNGTWLNARTVTNLVSISGSHEFDIDNVSGTFNVGDDLSWGTGGTAGTGIVSSVTASHLDLILISGVIPINDMTVTDDDTSATCDVNGSVTSSSTMVDGIKLKYRFTANADQDGLSAFMIDTTTTLQDQSDNLYPIDQDEVTVKVTAKDLSTGLNIEDARVLLEADAGGDLAVGTDIISGLTNSSGYIEDNAFVYTSNQPVVGTIRKATSPDSLYKPITFYGTITSNGLDLTGTMALDE